MSIFEEFKRIPEGKYTVWADDDDVIGLTVARSYPKGFSIVRTDPPLMDSFDEFEVAHYLAWCLTNFESIQRWKEQNGQ